MFTDVPSSVAAPARVKRTLTGAMTVNVNVPLVDETEPEVAMIVKL